MDISTRRLSVSEIACSALLCLWTIGEWHIHIESSSNSNFEHKYRFRTLLNAYNNVKSEFDRIRLSMKQENYTQLDEFSSRAAILSLIEQTGISALDVPELSLIAKSSSNLSTLLMIEKRQDFLSSIPVDMPADGYFASGFGERTDPFTGKKSEHKGLDISSNLGTEIRATADGIVRYAATFGRFGNYISVVHGHGFLTKYGHLQEILVKAGQPVRRGQVIARMGNSGKSTGVHLHYEIWINDHAFNPYLFLPKVVRHQNKSEPRKNFMLLAGQP